MYFQCPYCAKLYEELKDGILPLEKGNVRLADRYFPLPMHPWALSTAEAAACAYDQNNDYFWSFYDFIFDRHDELTAANLGEKLSSRAKELPGFDQPRFDACLAKHAMAARIDQDAAFARDNGIGATPTLFVNDHRVEGAVPPEQILTLIHQLGQQKHAAARRLANSVRSGTATAQAPAASKRRRRDGAAKGGLAANLFTVGAICLFALLYDPGLWSAVWNGDLPHSWDGSGGYAVAKAYADSIFPDTFGWLHRFSAGTPFPNYYPPLFQWLVAALTNWAGLPFDVAFKGVLAAAALSVPIGIWLIARAATRRRSIAILAALAAFPLLFGKQNYRPLGISYPSTFLVGLYAQPLGFFCAALWYRCFSRARRVSGWLISSIALGAVFISSFFTATVAAALWAATTAHTCFRAIRAPSPKSAKRLRRVAAWQALVFAIGLALAAFWLVPMLAERAFFVTRPTQTASS